MIICAGPKLLIGLWHGSQTFPDCTMDCLGSTMTQALCLLPLFNQILNVVHRQLTAGLQRGSWEQPEPRA